MDLTPYIRTLREDLLSAAALGDEETRRAAALLGAAIEPAGRLAIMNALSDFAAEGTAALQTQVVEIKVDGRDVRVSVSDKHHSEKEETSEQHTEYNHHLSPDELRR